MKRERSAFMIKKRTRTFLMLNIYIMSNFLMFCFLKNVSKTPDSDDHEEKKTNVNLPPIYRKEESESYETLSESSDFSIFHKLKERIVDEFAESKTHTCDFNAKIAEKDILSVENNNIKTKNTKQRPKTQAEKNRSKLNSIREDKGKSEEASDNNDIQIVIRPAETIEGIKKDCDFLRSIIPLNHPDPKTTGNTRSANSISNKSNPQDVSQSRDRVSASYIPKKSDSPAISVDEKLQLDPESCIKCMESAKKIGINAEKRTGNVDPYCELADQLDANCDFMKGLTLGNSTKSKKMSFKMNSSDSNVIIYSGHGDSPNLPVKNSDLNSDSMRELAVESAPSLMFSKIQPRFFANDKVIRPLNENTPYSALQETNPNCDPVENISAEVSVPQNYSSSHLMSSNSEDKELASSLTQKSVPKLIILKEKTENTTSLFEKPILIQKIPQYEITSSSKAPQIFLSIPKKLYPASKAIPNIIASSVRKPKRGLTVDEVPESSFKIRSFDTELASYLPQKIERDPDIIEFAPHTVIEAIKSSSNDARRPQKQIKIMTKPVSVQRIPSNSEKIGQQIVNSAIEIKRPSTQSKDIVITQPDVESAKFEVVSSKKAFKDDKNSEPEFVCVNQSTSNRGETKNQSRQCKVDKPENQHTCMKNQINTDEKTGKEAEFDSEYECVKNLDSPGQNSKKTPSKMAKKIEQESKSSDTNQKISAKKKPDSEFECAKKSDLPRDAFQKPSTSIEAQQSVNTKTKSILSGTKQQDSLEKESGTECECVKKSDFSNQDGSKSIRTQKSKFSDSEEKSLSEKKSDSECECVKKSEPLGVKEVTQTSDPKIKDVKQKSISTNAIKKDLVNNKSDFECECVKKSNSPSKNEKKQPAPTLPVRKENGKNNASESEKRNSSEKNTDSECECVKKCESLSQTGEKMAPLTQNQSVKNKEKEFISVNTEQNNLPDKNTDSESECVKKFNLPDRANENPVAAEKAKQKSQPVDVKQINSPKKESDGECIKKSDISNNRNPIHVVEQKMKNNEQKSKSADIKQKNLYIQNPDDEFECVNESQLPDKSDNKPAAPITTPKEDKGEQKTQPTDSKQSNLPKNKFDTECECVKKLNPPNKANSMSPEAQKAQRDGKITNKSDPKQKNESQNRADKECECVKKSQSNNETSKKIPDPELAKTTYPEDMLSIRPIQQKSRNSRSSTDSKKCDAKYPAIKTETGEGNRPIHSKPLISEKYLALDTKKYGPEKASICSDSSDICTVTEKLCENCKDLIKLGRKPALKPKKTVASIKKPSKSTRKPILAAFDTIPEKLKAPNAKIVCKNRENMNSNTANEVKKALCAINSLSIYEKQKNAQINGYKKIFSPKCCCGLLRGISKRENMSYSNRLRQKSFQNKKNPQIKEKLETVPNKIRFRVIKSFKPDCGSKGSMLPVRHPKLSPKDPESLSFDATAEFMADLNKMNELSGVFPRSTRSVKIPSDLDYVSDNSKASYPISETLRSLSFLKPIETSSEELLLANAQESDRLENYAKKNLHSLQRSNLHSLKSISKNLLSESESNIHGKKSPKKDYSENENVVKKGGPNNIKTTLVGSKNKKLDLNDARYSKYSSYCLSTYSYPKQENRDLKLQKVIIMHRHGDRAPLTIDTKFWKEEDCIESLIKDGKLRKPKNKKCEPGDLTIKGYDQMQELGSYIKKQYHSLNLQNYKARCTEVQRTQTSLHGLLYGLFKVDEFSEIECSPYNDDSLVIPKDCVYLNNVLQRTIADYFTEIIHRDEKYVHRNDAPPQRIADQYLAALCNNIPLECNKINCDDDIIVEYIETAFEAWKDQADRVKRIDTALEIVFGRFAGELKRYLSDQYELRILSVHDSSLTVILAGMGTSLDIHPPYASAIFVEIWNDNSGPKNDDKYVRVIFNDKACKTTLHKDVNIPFTKFIDYLDLIIKNSVDSARKCSDGESEEIRNSLEMK